MKSAPRDDQWFPFGLPVCDEVLRGTGETESLNASAVSAVRRIVAAMNRDHTRPPLRPGQVLTAGLITEALRLVWNLYRDQEPATVSGARAHAEAQLGDKETERCAASFVERYPSGSAPRSNENADREQILLRLTSENPAMEPLRELFDDEPLARMVPYRTLVSLVEEILAAGPPVPRLGLPLMEVLRAPMRAHPDSLVDQLEYVRTRWSGILPAGLLERMTLAADILSEEQHHRGQGPGPAEVMEFHIGPDDPEEERFSADADWMPNVVLMAKSTYVWLDQLSKKHGRDISTLDAIPDEELDILARWGFNGLWLIGLWERSPASKKIKRMLGNPEAESSAYSLHDYTIAADLGGEEAWRNLRDRARARGIRLAADMVPNHTGLDSRWIVDHPERFLHLDHLPYPGYRFSCEDLCDQADVTVQIEDGYWDRRDAAVVFKHTDHRDGRVRYVYHGNDGTSMPWNDTAQLDYLSSETREAVLLKILDVARRFPVIRFDAAMTLAKKHIQRLWYPQPGDAGAIPSRAEHGMSKDDFDRLVPAEFWREVVDRVAAEAPDTLLLAEAFWLMEGYFVRTLGMHRVYNSAFMNMIKMEQNSKYRDTIRNVLEFSPAVLGRFVNFMNNPDERTAAEQFGRGDKYIGCALLLVTLPGLPMWGHGQVEGFSEKYGMEYRRAYRDEQADQDLVRRHEAEIFPLMRRRRLFSGAEFFSLYDFVRSDGTVDENVFAYSNLADDDRALILYNNAYESTSGTIRTSCAVNTATGGAQALVRRSLAEALELPTGDADLTAFRDHRTGLHYLRGGRSLEGEGFHAALGGYQYHAFVDFRLLHDETGEWRRLEARLGGAGVPDLDLALEEQRHEPLLEAIRDLLDAVPQEKALFVSAALMDALADPGGEDILTRLLLRSSEDAALALAVSSLVRQGKTCSGSEALAEALRDHPAVRSHLQVHEHEGAEYMNAEAFEALVEAWFAFGATLGPGPAGGLDAETVLTLARSSGYRVAPFRSALNRSHEK